MRPGYPQVCDALVDAEGDLVRVRVRVRVRVGACHTKDQATGMSRVSCYYRRVSANADGGLVLSHVPPGEGGTDSSQTVSLRTAGLCVVAAAAAASFITAAALRRR